ncbi:hypothetical protein DRJ48_02075 [Candidatus Woesearchaeota archaeon]|nr:MAG: hypothetical protein DRJ48_02075 [Candidatus Woesearchaeota archaeon]
MESDDVLKLAENLRKNGLATSQEEAIAKAKMMLGMSFASKPEQAREEPKESEQEEEDFDITKENRPLKEIVSELEGETSNNLELKRMPTNQDEEISQEETQQPLNVAIEQGNQAHEEEQSIQHTQHPQNSPDKPDSKKKKYAEEDVDLTELFKA